MRAVLGKLSCIEVPPHADSDSWLCILRLKAVAVQRYSCILKACGGWWTGADPFLALLLCGCNVQLLGGGLG
jgi:hypothetical protein